MLFPIVMCSMQHILVCILLKWISPNMNLNIKFVSGMFYWIVMSFSPLHSFPRPTRWRYQPSVTLAVPSPSFVWPSLWWRLQSCREYPSIFIVHWLSQNKHIKASHMCCVSHMLFISGIHPIMIQCYIKRIWYISCNITGYHLCGLAGQWALSVTNATTSMPTCPLPFWLPRFCCSSASALIRAR